MAYLPYIILYAFVFMFAACIGSFLNVLIYRIPLGISPLKGRSHCTHCGKVLKGYDMIPVVSFFVLGGKCRFCKGKISPRYALIEALTGILGVLCAWLLGFSVQGLLGFYVCCILVVIVWIDIDTMEIPNGLVLALIPAGILAIWVFPQVDLLQRGIGLVCIALPMLLMNFAIKDAFGGGDIKLMAVAGFFLGWKLTLLATFLALLGGGGYGVYLLASKKKGRKDHFAFGPFLGLGIVVAMLCGEEIISFYLSLFLL